MYYEGKKRLYFFLSAISENTSSNCQTYNFATVLFMVKKQLIFNYKKKKLSADLAQGLQVFTGDCLNAFGENEWEEYQGCW